MGLDMYLTRRRDVSKEYNTNRKLYEEEQVMYWRKANQIHNWFVENIQDGIDDCRIYYVSKEKLKELLKVCEEVLDLAEKMRGSSVDNIWEDNRKIILSRGRVIDKTKFEDILPTCSGFFFGRTEYDEDYLETVKDTALRLSEILSEDDGENEYYYQSSW